MNSIRPLVTITMLVVVGAFLYVKINQGPVRPASNAGELWQDQQPTDGVPPLAALGTAPADSSSSAAPAWPANDATPPPVVPGDAAATASNTVSPSNEAPAATIADSGPAITPAVPAIPELLDMSTSSAAPEAASVAPPTGLPANIPTARYPDQPAANETAALNTSENGAAPPAPSVAAASEPISPPLATEENSLRPAASPGVDEADRYAASVYGTNPTTAPANITPIEPTFPTAWPAVQAALARGELARAHQLLSRWYGNASLTPTDAERVESLLGQLAGTVVYSTDHHLEPPHIVKPGETLETIAEEYKVPWQLLAKINGIPTADAVQPGQELKVVRGPFSAVVDLDRKELVLMVDDRYAGRFVITPPNSGMPAGEWILQQKLLAEGKASPSNFAVVTYALLLQNSAATAPVEASPVVIGSRPAAGDPILGTSGTPVGGHEVPQHFVRVSDADVVELADILSVGSRVEIRR